MSDHLTFVGEWGMGDLVWVRIFSQTCGVSNLFPDLYWCKIFFQHYKRHKRFFFSAGYYFSQVYPCKLSLLKINLQDTFCSEITHNLIKSQIFGRLSPPNICSVDIICQSFLKPFETIGDKTPWGDGKNSFLLTSTRRVSANGSTATS